MSKRKLAKLFASKIGHLW